MSHHYVVTEKESGVQVNHVFADSPSNIELQDGQQLTTHYVITDENGVFVNRVVADSPSDIALNEGQQVVDDDPSLYTMPLVATIQPSTPIALPEDPVVAQQILLHIAQNNSTF